MRYKGKEIGQPSLQQIEEFVAKCHMVCKAIDIYNHYKKNGFLNKKGNPIQTLESMCNTYNGIIVNRERKEIRERELGKLKSNPVAPTQISEYKPYSEQLNDNRWLAFRQFVLIVRGAKCEVCGAKKNLNIHHLHYNSGSKAWEYNVNEVMVLCHDCHKKIHNIK